MCSDVSNHINSMLVFIRNHNNILPDILPVPISPADSYPLLGGLASWIPVRDPGAVFMMNN